MSNLIGIVNYGIAGNIFSIKEALEKAGGNVFIINKPADFERADKIVIPGVGSFKDAMEELGKDGFIEPIKSYKKPILGICLGMQIMSHIGFEYGRTKGLGLIHAEVKDMLVEGVIPHMGFNKISIINNNKVLDGLDGESFYFMHSFEMVSYTNASALTDYCGHKFVSAVQCDNIYGVQFHPEKSREAGISLFRNFLNI
jgi:imidazole glycerol phosphate synthase glutamine amidotransferase subunit